MKSTLKKTSVGFMKFHWTIKNHRNSIIKIQGPFSNFKYTVTVSSNFIKLYKATLTGIFFHKPLLENYLKLQSTRARNPWNGSCIKLPVLWFLNFPVDFFLQYRFMFMISPNSVYKAINSYTILALFTSAVYICNFIIIVSSRLRTMNFKTRVTYLSPTLNSFSMHFLGRNSHWGTARNESRKRTKRRAKWSWKAE